MSDISLDQQIESILFYRSTPIRKVSLQKALEANDQDFHEALTALTTRLKSGAIRLLETKDTVALVTAPEVSGLINRFRKAELQKDIGRAGAETLAIVLYRSPITRSEIEAIRGVSSSYIIRSLLIRGLIEKNTDNKRPTYQITSNLLMHLGITGKSELPNYDTVVNRLSEFEMTTVGEVGD